MRYLQTLTSTVHFNIIIQIYEGSKKWKKYNHSWLKLWDVVYVEIMYRFFCLVAIFVEADQYSTFQYCTVQVLLFSWDICRHWPVQYITWSWLYSTDTFFSWDTCRHWQAFQQRRIQPSSSPFQWTWSSLLFKCHFLCTIGHSSWLQEK